MESLTSKTLNSFLVAEVPGWKDDVQSAALFKAFTGQRQDWQEKLQLWKGFVTKAARHLDHIIVDAEEVQNTWFLRNGLAPLCIRDVLVDMINSGDLVRMEDLAKHPPKIKRLVLHLANAILWAGHSLLGLTGAEDKIVGKLVVPILVEEKVTKIVELLNQTSWKSSCILTMRKMRDLCGGRDEAHVVVLYLFERGLVCHLLIPGEDEIEGFKISLISSKVCKPLQSDYYMLQLIWTIEMLEQRLDILHKKVFDLKISTFSAVKSGNKRAALRHLECCKHLQATREKCLKFMKKIEEVVRILLDAETTKKVSDAIKIGNSAIKEHHLTLGEVQEELDELDESILRGRQITEVIADQSLDDDHLEEEFLKLEQELGNFEDLELQVESSLSSPVHRYNGHLQKHASGVANAAVGEQFQKLTLESM